MFLTLRIRKKVLLFALTAGLLLAAVFPVLKGALPADAEPERKDYIKWVDFNVPESLLEAALDLDLETYEDPGRSHLDWVECLAYLGAKYGGDFSLYQRKDLNDLAQKVESGEDITSLAQDMKYYGYYREAYGAVLGNLVGEYELETENGWEKRYGLKGYSPIAKTFPYSDYDDFGAGRSYGYKRKHLGHDMMAAVGTPVIAVESGVVEALGWNQYGGWRIGIRSFDGKRYHYYAHLRQNRPYAQGLETGQTVMAGDVIGYVGRTGYSTKENTNNINVSHLHYGLQLIFDESQKEGPSEIWVDVYALCCLLQRRQSEVRRDDATKEWSRTQAYREEIPKNHFFPSPSPSAGEAPKES